MSTLTARYAAADPAYVAVNVQAVALPFGRRLLIRQFATALSVSVTVPAANELLPLFIDALNRPNVKPVRMREAAAADTARPVTASSRGRLTSCAPTWRMRDTSLPSGPAVRAGREGAGTRFPPRAVRSVPEERGGGVALRAGHAGARQRVVARLHGVKGQRHRGAAALVGVAGRDRDGVVEREADRGTCCRRRGAHQQVRRCSRRQRRRGAALRGEGGACGGCGAGEVGGGRPVLQVELKAGGGAVVENRRAVADGHVDGQPRGGGAGVLHVVRACGAGLAADGGA